MTGLIIAAIAGLATGAAGGTWSAFRVYRRRDRARQQARERWSA